MLQYDLSLQALATDSKQRQEVEKKMHKILSELIRYVIFMYLVLLMAYAQRDNNIFYNNQFVASHGFNLEDATDLVTTPPDVLDFMEEVIAALALT